MLIFGLVSLKVSPGTNEVVERLRVFFAMGAKKKIRNLWFRIHYALIN